ncbi:MAG: hypothetical protein EB015_19685 [Methylocystaceae bacterium]|nr:hypothetical protein [Methylocystaceae bacterium]
MEEEEEEKEIRILGQGGFGCVYYRGFKPDGTALSGAYVTKITRREKSREAIIGKRVANMSRYADFFAAVLKVENINLANVDAENLLLDCDIVSKNNGPREKFQLLTQIYVPNVSFLEFAGMHHPNFAKFLSTLISCRDHLLLGIARLQSEARVVHFDIKSENVVFNTRTKNPVIIDFGLSFVADDALRELAVKGAAGTDYDRVKRLKQFFYGYFPDYSAWSIEVHIICYIVSETVADHESKMGSGTGAIASVSIKALKTMLSVYISNHLFLRYQTDAYKAAFYDRAVARYERSAVGRPGMEVIREYVGNWKAWDVHASSVLFLDVLEIVARRRQKAFPAEYAAQVDAFSESLQRDAGFIE